MEGQRLDFSHFQILHKRNGDQFLPWKKFVISTNSKNK